jgi:predicted Holliday junction resolvase-like endonuclease
MALEIILLIIGLVIGFFVARWIFSKQKWSDKEQILNEKWKVQIAELEKTYAVKLEQKNTTLEQVKKDWQVKYIQDIDELKKLFKESEKIIRLKSVSSSRRSLVGKFIEKFVPFLNKIPFEPSDMHFLGSPIDYIVFEGLHEDNVQRITFVEVKTGESKLTKREKSLKDAVEKKKVSWKEIDIDTTEENVPDKEMENPETTISALYENIDEKLRKISGR